MGKESFLPPKGTRDIEPLDSEIRNKVIDIISESYKKYGFSSIETPSYETIENLIGRKGGENEKLIFKILKRGDELKKALTELPEEGNSLADFGLRYDLTVPLARYYANYKDRLPKPFKVFQIGNVWRAERPQKGRYRQFTQCDIDIIGDDSPNCEIELIYVTYKTLKALKIENFIIRINDRNILKEISKKCGISGADNYRDFLIALDKLDKISLDKVIEELAEKGFDNNILKNIKSEFSKLKDNDYISNSVDLSDNLRAIINTLKELCPDINIKFDPTLVRGMDYYTGTIYEVSEIGGNISFGGGGRYNNMVGNFSGQETSACGFSLGFERIIDAFFSSSLPKSMQEEKLAVLCSLQDDYKDVINVAEKLREDGKYQVVSVFQRQKNLNNQLEKLKNIGFSCWMPFKTEHLVLNSDNILEDIKILK